MACPFFHPLERFEDGAWLTPPRLPLGDPCLGECTVDPSGPVTPALDEIRQHCNLGYARSRCSRFPDRQDSPDAVRFSVAGERDGAIELVWILEKDYAPLSHGTLVYDPALGKFSGALDTPNVRAQARMFVASYLHRRVKS